MYLLSFPKFWTLSIERFWFLFWSILNGVTLKTSNTVRLCPQAGERRAQDCRHDDLRAGLWHNEQWSCFFFFFLFCRLFLDSGRLHKNDTCCLLLFIYSFDVVQRSRYGTGHDNLLADVLWGRNECVTNEPQRTSAGRLGTRGRHECLLRAPRSFLLPLLPGL